MSAAVFVKALLMLVAPGMLAAGFWGVAAAVAALYLGVLLGRVPSPAVVQAGYAFFNCNLDGLVIAAPADFSSHILDLETCTSTIPSGIACSPVTPTTLHFS